MSLSRSVPVLLAVSALAMGLSAGTAAAAGGDVVVFETEVQQLTTYTSPEGCHKLPMAAHVLVNNTDKPVQIYGDPFCLTPSLTVAPGYGSHVAPGSGSFSA
ncbi:hypothetical protein LZ318_33265 [Saccharopolyspora indica]|uniref:hypothetical protein n=1 Tax=Saccharopolyspora indica TaxID=1229659 RepID=UPI0022EB613B|nr:hypothetical protein [Saccharopolyspora indica]MDA3643887.1 hypothetical protein [Saccharopolyspora indica]